MVPYMVESKPPDMGVMVEAAVCVVMGHVFVVRFNFVVRGT